MALPIFALSQQFDPRRIANLTGWFDALDSAAYTSVSDQISEWLDKSGNGRHLAQTTANNRPTLFDSVGDVQGSTRAVLNGRQALFFDRANDQLTSTATFTTTHARTVFSVLRTATTNDNQSSWSLGPLTGSTVRLISYEGSATSGSKLITTDTVGVNSSTTATRDSTVAHVSCHSQTTNRVVSYFLNGTSLALTSATTLTQTAFDGLQLGSQPPGGNNRFGGYFGELLIYDRELSALERDAITRYLGGRWGIAVA